MNSFKYAQQASLVGTDQQIVDQLIASGVTHRSIGLAELLYLLNLRRMLIKLAVPGVGGEKWIGTVMSVIEAVNANGTNNQKMQLSIWFSHITNPRNQNWNTTETIHAAPFWQLYLAFAGQPGMPTQADFEAIAELGGGWLFADLTVEQYQADKQQIELAEAKRQLISVAATRYNEFVSAVEAWDGSGNEPVL